MSELTMSEQTMSELTMSEQTTTTNNNNSTIATNRIKMSEQLIAPQPVITDKEIFTYLWPDGYVANPLFGNPAHPKLSPFYVTCPN